MADYKAMNLYGNTPTGNQKASKHGWIDTAKSASEFRYSKKR